MELIDFDNSYITWLTKDDSYGRFNIEAVSQTENVETGITNNFYLLSTVMACNVFGKNDLFHYPAYTFTAIFSKDKIKRIRNYSDKINNNSDIKFITDIFKNVNYHIELRKYAELNNTENIIETTLKNQKIIAVIENKIDEINNIKYIFPVKHINVKHVPSGQFQVETGPIISHVNNTNFSFDSLSLFFVAFNNCKSYNLIAHDDFESYKRGNKFIINEKILLLTRF